jgi:hypothetical protein
MSPQGNSKKPGSPTSGGGSTPPPKRDLWKQAYDQIGSDKDTASLMQEYERIVARTSTTKKKNTPSKVVGVQEQMAVVVEERMQVMTNKQWILQWGQKSIKVRDQVERIIKVIQALSGLGSAAASLDPTHAGLVWAGVCVVLPVSKHELTQNSHLVCLSYTDRFGSAHPQRL